ncbi:AraC family transcriptional regulator [Roseibium sediminis]|uniref:AraC family transcriptional regulator n=1 Tax=Roseibium sediminis TaxID=1775174 RepID=UPI001375A6D4|nr:AraC family transcriptional regulator [Roseibium sediminis]
MRSMKFWVRSDFIKFLKTQPYTRTLDWKQIEDRHSLTEEATDNPLGIVAADIYFSIFEETAKSLGSDALYFDLMYEAPVGPFSASDYLFVCAPDLRTSLQSMVDYAPARTNAVDFIFEENENYGVFEWRMIEGLGEWRQSMFGQMAITVRHIELVLGDDKPPLTMELAAEPPISKSAFLAKYENRVTFNTLRNRILIPRHMLSRPNNRHEENLYQIILRASAQDLETFREYDSDISRVTTQIVENLKAGNCTLPEVSKALGMSQRTLQRVLETEGSSFRTLVDKVRKSAARRYIVNSNLPFKEIAYLLGFSELSTFSRAVKAWYGVSPRGLRDKKKTELSRKLNR